MNEISKERIEISGVEYTLFLNRQGLVSWEKYSREENAKLQEMETKYANVSNEITDDTNPFEAVNEELNDSEIVSKTFRKLYWIMLYTEHKLSLAQVNELYDKACEEYGEVQLIQLAQQMIEDMNIDKISKTELKNLTALRPKKK
jgi:predicted negative regulator of RcsB-dependent stress response|nr:MAG TPA: hypothetical protein [Bacteriophage sp.]